MAEAGLLAFTASILIGLACPGPCAPGAPVEGLEDLAPVDPGLDPPSIERIQNLSSPTDRASLSLLLGDGLPGPGKPISSQPPSTTLGALDLQPAQPDRPRTQPATPVTHVHPHDAAPTVQPEFLDPGDQAHPHAARTSQASTHGAFSPDGPVREQALGMLVGLVLIGLYHHLSKERALEHPTRQRIRSMLEEEPGLTTAELSRRLACCYRTTRHHLDKLARFDLVASRRDGNAIRWCLPGAKVPAARRMNEVQRETLGLLEGSPGLHLSELARRLDAAKATVKFQLDALHEEGYVRDERVGPLRRFFLTDEGAGVLGD